MKTPGYFKLSVRLDKAADMNGYKIKEIQVAIQGNAEDMIVVGNVDFHIQLEKVDNGNIAFQMHIKTGGGDIKIGRTEAGIYIEQAATADIHQRNPQVNGDADAAGEDRHISFNINTGDALNRDLAKTAELHIAINLDRKTGCIEGEGH